MKAPKAYCHSCKRKWPGPTPPIEGFEAINAAALAALVTAVQNHIIFIERPNLEILARAVALAISRPHGGTDGAA